MEGEEKPDEINLELQKYFAVFKRYFGRISEVKKLRSKVKLIMIISKKYTFCVPLAIIDNRPFYHKK